MYNIHEILKKYWGHSAFRPLQQPIIEAVLQGKDVLALLPTGGGKSVCFQVPALAVQGVCIVVSPLIALMKDQVHNLQKKGIPAECIYSGMHSNEILKVIENAINLKIKFLYLSPERLQTELLINSIKKMQISLLAIDEAHCISQWGYDFRPAYLLIADFKKILPNNTPTLALTATATPQVKKDITQKLEFKKNALTFEKSFKRDNLSYSVRYKEDKIQETIHILKKINGTGIVYVRNRKSTQKIAEILQKNGISADFYHAGLPPQQRSYKQEQWIKNNIRVIVCTNAFGMGIDKPDVRIVVHIDPPDSIEAYYQEAGRAGRDEKLAYAVLLYNNHNVRELRESIEKNFPDISTIKQVYNALGNYYKVAVGAGALQTFEFEIADFAKKYQLDIFDIHNSLKIIEQHQYISLSDAFFQPSKLFFLVTNKILYEYEVANKKIEPYIQALTRTYGGLFDNYVSINEKNLAKFLNVNEQYVKNALTVLHKNKIVDYIPQTDKPQITFLEARMNDNYLKIDTKLLNFRKQVRQQNVEAIILYAQNKITCRSQQLVRYFNDLESTDCQKCDICIEYKKVQKSNALNNDIVSEMKKICTTQNVDIKQVIEQLSVFKKNDVARTIRQLADNYTITIDATTQQIRWN